MNKVAFFILLALLTLEARCRQGKQPVLVGVPECVNRKHLTPRAMSRLYIFKRENQYSTYSIAFSPEYRLYHHYLSSRDEVHGVKHSAHGAFIGNTVVQVNPKVKLVFAEIPMYEDIKDQYTLRNMLRQKPREAAHLFCDAFEYSVNFMDSLGVKVIPIAWIWNLSFFERFFGKDVPHQQRIEWLEVFKARMRKIIADHPNILFLMAAGNDSKDTRKNLTVHSMIKLPNALTVGAFDNDCRNRASYSNYGPLVDIWAASDVEVDFGGKRLYPITFSGTSAATAVAAAWAAHWLGQGLSQEEVVRRLKEAGCLPAHIP
ncbi:MAG: hypothetical protein KatS3mg033_2387 [Thermonema sp.]|uniref:S8 family serine peptidase n=1 Tax=Thermonema sp. TaxID=2231181 RepID=UPI0021DC59CD|nr:S8 family serine peptidase [Thermonema sp.]GIV40587.1 MAG: hypothetical protein KatS3mg033_2387 [Thermonema sp.]